MRYMREIREMADDNFTLDTYYKGWEAYQNQIKNSIASLSDEQLALRPAPDLRSVGENVAHIIGCRAGWFTYAMKEEWSADATAPNDWDDKDPRTAAELVQALDATWQGMMASLARWSPADMQETFEDDWDGKIVHLSRAWIVWHVLEHDLHHGGEISYTLGMHGVPTVFTS